MSGASIAMASQLCSEYMQASEKENSPWPGAENRAGLSPRRGHNVNILPHIDDNGDITLYVELEISNIAGTVNLGGINEPIIGQRKVTHDIRLREGEVNLVAGLINTSNSKTVIGIPGLASVPILGKLFSGDTVDKNRDEIMIAIIPHVVRQPSVTPENIRAKAVGNSTP